MTITFRGKVMDNRKTLAPSSGSPGRRAWRVRVEGSIKGAAVALCLSMAPATADSARVEVRANVPASCIIDLGNPNVVSRNPLVITVPVTRDCNTTHSVSVTYEPAELTFPRRLVMALGVILPSEKLPGLVTFGNLPNTTSTRILRIAYDGPAAERLQIATTVQIAVTME
jgi:hypothetical protein